MMCIRHISTCMLCALESEYRAHHRKNVASLLAGAGYGPSEEQTKKNGRKHTLNLLEIKLFDLFYYPE